MNSPISPEQAKDFVLQGVRLVTKHGRNPQLITALGDSFLLAGDVRQALNCFFCAQKYDATYEPAKQKYDSLRVELQNKKLLPADHQHFDSKAIWEATSDDYNQLVANKTNRDSQQELIKSISLSCQDNDKVLMPCCGVGQELATLQQLKPSLQITGLDFSAEQLRHAQERCGDSIEFIQGDATKLPFPDNSFDLAFTIGGLMALPDAMTVLQEMNRVSRKKVIIAEVSLEHIPEQDTYRALKLINPGIWMHPYEQIIAKCGLEITEIKQFPEDYITCFELSSL